MEPVERKRNAFQIIGNNYKNENRDALSTRGHTYMSKKIWSDNNTVLLARTRQVAGIEPVEGKRNVLQIIENE